MAPLGGPGPCHKQRVLWAPLAPRTRPVPLRRRAELSRAEPCQAHGPSHLLGAPGATPLQIHWDVPWSSPRKTGEDAQSRARSLSRALSFALEVRRQGKPGGCSLHKAKRMGISNLFFALFSGNLGAVQKARGFTALQIRRKWSAGSRSFPWAVLNLLVQHVCFGQPMEKACKAF